MNIKLKIYNLNKFIKETSLNKLKSNDLDKCNYILININNIVYQVAKYTQQYDGYLFFLNANNSTIREFKNLKDLKKYIKIIVLYNCGE